MFGIWRNIVWSDIFKIVYIIIKYAELDINYISIVLVQPSSVKIYGNYLSRLRSHSIKNTIYNLKVILFEDTDRKAPSRTFWVLLKVECSFLIFFP